MTEDWIIVRFGEITVKGRNRTRFEELMLARVKEALAAFRRLTYDKSYGRLYIRLNGESFDKVADRLKDVFGIVSFSPAMRTANELAAIREAALAVMRAVDPPPRTFKVSVKRAYKGFPHDSREMNHLVGAHVLRNTPNLKVDVHQPEVELKVEIREEGTFVHCRTVPAAGGFPLGMNGKAMLLLSGGIDSPVAGWMMMRKGLELEAVHFHSYPYTSEQSKEKVIALAQRLAYYGGRMKLHVVPFTELQTRLAQTGYEHLMVTLMRRAMLRIAERLAEKSGQVPFSPEESEALYRVRKVAASPELYLDMGFKEGDIQFLNNRMMVHGRTDYEDAPELENRRHLLRLWFEVPTWPAMPQAQVFHTAQDRAMWSQYRQPLIELPSVHYKKLLEGSLARMVD